MPLWVQNPAVHWPDVPHPSQSPRAVHWPDVPHPSQSPRAVLEKLVSGHQSWGGGIPESEAARQEVGWGDQTASILGSSLLFHLTGIRAQSWLAP